MDEVLDVRARSGWTTTGAAQRVARGIAGLEQLATDGAARGLTRDDVVEAAVARATELRDAVGALAEIDEELAGRLHDRALQLIEYVATDAFGAGLERERMLVLVGRAAAEGRRALLPVTGGTHDLEAELRGAARDAQVLGLPPVTLHGRVRRDVPGEDVAALAGAVHEALNNVRKHAHASNVTISIEERRRELCVLVADDGVGAGRQATEGASGLGVRGSISGRVRRRGGWARVHGRAGAGTRVELSIPMAEVA